MLCYFLLLYAMVQAKDSHLCNSFVFLFIQYVCGIISMNRYSGRFMLEIRLTLEVQVNPRACVVKGNGHDLSWFVHKDVFKQKQ